MVLHRLLVVQEELARLGLPAEQETCQVANRDYITICKFLGADDPEWGEVSAAIAEAAKAARVSYSYYSPMLRCCAAMFTPQAVENRFVTSRGIHIEDEQC